MAAQVRSHQKRSRKFTSKIKEESGSSNLLHENHIGPQIEEREDLFAQAIGWRSSTTIPVKNPDKHKIHRSRSHHVSPAHISDSHNTLPNVIIEDNHEIGAIKCNTERFQMEDDNAIILGKCYASIESVVYELDSDPSQKYVAYYCGDEAIGSTTNALQIVTVDPYALASDTSESECSCFCDSDDDEGEINIEDPIPEVESPPENKVSPMDDQAMRTDIRWTRHISISLPQSPNHPPDDIFENNSFTFEDLKPSDIERMIANSINILDDVRIDGFSDQKFGTNSTLMAGSASSIKAQVENDNVGETEKAVSETSTSSPVTESCQEPTACNESVTDLVEHPEEKQSHTESDSSKNDSELKMDEATSIFFDNCLEKVMNSSDLIFESDDFSTIINDFGGVDIPIESPCQPKDSKPVFDFDNTIKASPLSVNSNSMPNRNFVMSTPKKPIKISSVFVGEESSQQDGYQNFTANISKKAMNFDSEDIIDIESVSDGENVPVLAANNLDSLLEQFEASESLHLNKKPLKEHKKEDKPGNGMIHLDHDYCSPEKKQVLIDRKNLKTGLGRGKKISIGDGFKGEANNDNPSDHSYTIPRKVRRLKEQAVPIQKNNIEPLAFVPNKPRSFTKQQSLLKPAVKEEIKKVSLLKQSVAVKPETESIKEEPIKSDGKDIAESSSVIFTQAKQIEKVVPQKKKLNLEEYKRRRGTTQVRSCEGSRVSSPVTVPTPHMKTYSTPNSPVNMGETNLQPVKMEGSLQEASKGVSSSTFTTSPQLFDPIAEATKKALKLKKIKAKICPEDKIIQSKIPKQNDMVILPLATMNGRLLPMIKKASEVVPCVPSDKPVVKPQCDEYEEIIMVSIGVNTEPVQDLPCVKSSPKTSSINFKICKKTAVLKSNIFKKATKESDGEAPSSASFDSSLISSIKSVIAQKEKHPTEATDVTKEVSASADLATTQGAPQEHGEDKVIMHLKKDRSKPLTLSAYSQTDSNFVEIIKLPDRTSPVKLSEVRKRTRSPSSERSSYRSRRVRKSRSSERSRTSESSSRSRYRSQRQSDIHRNERFRRSRSRSRDNQRRYSDYDTRSHKSGRSSVSNNSSRSSYGRHRSFRRRSRSRDHLSSLRKTRTVSESSHTSSTGSTSSVSTTGSSSSRFSSSTNSSASHRQESYKPASPRKLEPMEERRVVFVGRLEKTMDREQMRRMFSRFGYVREVTLHRKDDGSRYGFVTFAKAQQSYQVVECASKDPELQRYDVSFGGRRAFCRHLYADLDDLGPFEESGYYADTVPTRPVIYQKGSSNFDTLLQEMKQAVEKKRLMQRSCKDE